MVTYIAVLALLTSAVSFGDEQRPVEPATPVQQTDPAPRVRTAYAGAFLGPAVVTSSNSGGTSNFLTYGGHAGAGIYSSPGGSIAFGVAVNAANMSETIQGVQVSAQATFLTAEILGRELGGTGFYMGGRFGIALESLTISSGANSIGASSTTGAVAPVVGYEVPVTPFMNICADISWMNHFSGSITLGTTSVSYPSSSSLLMQGGLLFRF